MTTPHPHPPAQSAAAVPAPPAARWPTSRHARPGKPPRLPWLGLVCALALLLAGPAHAKRVALLMGNASYQVGSLTNPPNDVAEMEKALKALRFDVQKVLNASQNQMKRAVRDFGTAAQGADVAFVYYSGHATQASGENYLLPVGATIEKESDYAIEAIAANDVLAQIRGAQPKAAILVLDACRDNPLAAVTKSATKGLSRMSAPTGMLIAFATEPNNVASDNGDYARVLAAELQKPGQELLDVFRNTGAEVKRLSGGRQEPRISEVSINDRIYLVNFPQAATVPQSQVEVNPGRNSVDPDHETWELTKRRDSIQSYQSYLAAFPHGKYAFVARTALQGLTPDTQTSSQTVAGTSIETSPAPSISGKVSQSTTPLSYPISAGSSAHNTDERTVRKKDIDCKGNRLEVMFADGQLGCLSNYSIIEMTPLNYFASISSMIPGSGNAVVVAPMPFLNCPKFASYASTNYNIGNLLEDLGRMMDSAINSCRMKLNDNRSSCKCEAVLIQGKSPLAKLDFEKHFR